MSEEEVAELSKMAGTDFTGFAKTNRISMQETLRWFDEYLGQHPEVELVYRRHPSEWNSPALESLAKKAAKLPCYFCRLGQAVDRCRRLDLDLDEHRHRRGVHGGQKLPYPAPGADRA